MAKKKEDTSEIPKFVLHNLIEFTAGGFLLFHFNQKTGFPEHLMTFDSPAHYLAMTKYITDWSTASNKMHVAVAGQDIGKIITIEDDNSDT